MSTLDKMMMQYAVESGEVVPEEVVEVTASEVIAEHSDVSGGTTEVLDHADKAESIADQLDELADRAEELADEDKSFAEKAISVESMHREFGTIMAANGLTLPATSFESAMSDAARVQGIVKDARGSAVLMRNLSANLSDASAEGKIIQFLRRDAAKLIDADKALANAKRALTSEAASIKKEPTVIKNRGVAHFMVVDGSITNRFPEAIASDTDWLKAAREYVNASFAEIQTCLKSGTAPKFKSFPLPKQGLLNNTSLKVDGEGNRVPSVSVRAEMSNTDGDIAGMAGHVALSFLGWCIVGGIAAGAALIVLPAAVGAAVGGVVGTGVRVASAVKSIIHGGDKLDEYLASGNAASSAGYTDILKAIETVSTLSGSIEFKLDDDAYEAALKEAVAAGHDAAVLKDIKASYSNLIRVIDVIYEHSFLIVVKTALVAEQTAKLYK